ncbi:MAG: hypothetical protein HY706_21285 [Candidatus Hydrogenedentes bacterium]|nr:hypothetical protein [Candidatus Hydrogenedentota bacterium]
MKLRRMFIALGLVGVAIATGVFTAYASYFSSLATGTNGGVYVGIGTDTNPGTRTLQFAEPGALGQVEGLILFGNNNVNQISTAETPAGYETMELKATEVRLATPNNAQVIASGKDVIVQLGQ